MPNLVRARIHQQDIDNNGLFEHAVMQLPANVTRQMREGWPHHIPLDYLSKDDNGRFVVVQGNEQSLRVPVDSDDSLGSFIEPLTSFSENSMEYKDWVQTYPRFLQLISDFYPGPDYAELSAAFRTHFNRLCADPDIQEWWPAYLAYDIRMRELFSSHGVFPDIFQENILNAETRRFIISIAASRDNDDDNRRSRGRYEDDNQQNDSVQNSSPGRHHSHPYSGKSQYSPMFCVLCGNTGHPSRDCRMPANHSLYQNNNYDWVRPDGRQFCFNWNGNPSACKRERTGCNRIHACSLCGQSGHHARICRLARL